MYQFLLVLIGDFLQHALYAVDRRMEQRAREIRVMRSMMPQTGQLPPAHAPGRCFKARGSSLPIAPQERAGTSLRCIRASNRQLKCTSTRKWNQAPVRGAHKAHNGTKSCAHCRFVPKPGVWSYFCDLMQHENSQICRGKQGREFKTFREILTASGKVMTANDTVYEADDGYCWRCTKCSAEPEMLAAERFVHVLYKCPNQ